ncbi:MAG: 5-oxoprolinase [Rhodospirillales bacterium]|jgi:5-oxoprolinase (ATP-hydrolysing)|nr:5-oxoprolinase [Rhodospirillales bacterium]MBT4006237.1 5-oxoprolinase [Rhodospirillales bacterium]MBT5076730.1 5-oxoprolinase [Rhodospirillales bacterium]MBT5113181.1 5-oxoprolinase [Rhodospirillales bacterium]MBT5673057.1 5-oxoprolinase [Rhodospirillales bacterium]
MTLHNKWQFWIDRGGTFTDVVALSPSGLCVTEKLLSDNPGHYPDAVIEAMRRILVRETGLAADAPLAVELIGSVRMGTTVATNALLERKGEKLILVTTEGFGDALRIGYQNRPDLFALDIQLPSLLHASVLEVPGRVMADGTELTPLNLETARIGLMAAYDTGCRAVAIVFMHAWRFPDHENAIADLARKLGFTQISLSHEISPLMRFVGRGDTTVADAYLSPVLRTYVDRVETQLGKASLLFMQSNGDLTSSARFKGRDAVLSGPAGGIVGAVKTAAVAGMDHIITFDMGGTSTDVAHFDGDYERVFETTIAGVRLRAPMMGIHTVAAGGGSVLRFHGGRFQVGPESAGADPGPACYGRGGPLTVTDANLVLGRIRTEFFPPAFGPNADQLPDVDAALSGFEAMGDIIRQETGKAKSVAEIAEGFLSIAIDNMAAAIAKVSTQRGHDVTRYGLVAFGGAGGQHACRVADALGIHKIMIHPMAGMLSALGMGLADIGELRESAVEAAFEPALMGALKDKFETIEAQAREALLDQGLEASRITVIRHLRLRYGGTDTGLMVPIKSDGEDYDEICAAFADRHNTQFGFVMADTPLIAEAVSVEAVAGPEIDGNALSISTEPSEDAPEKKVAVTFDGVVLDTPVFTRASISKMANLNGPALVSEDGATTVIEPGWQGHEDDGGALILERNAESAGKSLDSWDTALPVDPIMLEVFNNLFMSIAEEMGAALQNTAHSVNIKERLDFSCAVFDPSAQLIANAPHMPVHLGSMGAAVRAVIDRWGKDGKDQAALSPGDVFLHNAPYDGGTHLPDITVIRPVFNPEGAIIFFVAARGHHADIGGTHPGSMPPQSTRITEEGILFSGERLIAGGVFQEEFIRGHLASGPWPARNANQNIADLKAQAAACARGAHGLDRMVAMFGYPMVRAYMNHVQDNAEEAVRRMISKLDDGEHTVPLDDGSFIKVAVRVDRKARSAVVDFTGTSIASPTNFNAPVAVCRAAVLYTFRALVNDPIPMNDGCLRPITIIIPKGSLLSPTPPAAVVAGNVETSQCIVDGLLAATNRLAAGPGTMNNFTFGDDTYQYYETICSGAGAGPGFDGADAVQTHMTNSRLTDPEVLEWRYPVLLESFSIRKGSGGQGKYHGGNGVVRRIRFLAPMKAALLANRHRTQPFGINGGEDGASGAAWVERMDGGIEKLGPTAEVSMGKDDVFVILTPGGGGYGSPESGSGN